MAVTSILQTLLVNAHYVFVFLAVGVGLGGMILFLHEALIDHRRQAASRFRRGNLYDHSFMDE